MRALRKPFVVTASLVTLVACGKESSGPQPEPVHPNPPYVPPPDSGEAHPHTNNPPAFVDAGGATSTAVDAAPAGDRFDTSRFTKELNPKDAKGHTLFKAYEGDKCFAELDWPKGKPRMPGQRAPSEDAACPADLKKPGWDACRGGWISTTAKGDDCICVQWGNPPPLPKRIACP